MVETHQQQIVVIGALAYDQIATTSAQFNSATNTLLNCKLDTLAETFGGCGGNIAYNLARLGHTNTHLVSCTGETDDQRYLAHLEKLGIDTTNCLREPAAHCARALIITDTDGHQFTGFFPGYVPDQDTWLAHLDTLPLAGGILIQAPYPPVLMISALKKAALHPNAPLKICCPGQYADQLNPQQTNELVNACDWLIGNAYELSHIRQHAPTEHRLVIETNGAQAVNIYTPGQPALQQQIAPVDGVVDPTGCGDAFLAGMSYQLNSDRAVLSNNELLHVVEFGTQVAARCLLHDGGQTHTFN